MTEAANRLNIFGNRIEPSEYPMVSVLDSRLMIRWGFTTDNGPLTKDHRSSAEKDRWRRDCFLSDVTG